MKTRIHACHLLAFKIHVAYPVLLWLMLAGGALAAGPATKKAVPGPDDPGWPGRAAWIGLDGVTNAVSAEGIPSPVYGLTAEYCENPVGLGSLRPRFGWKLVPGPANLRQTAYRVRVGTARGKADLWDSGRVECGQSVNVVYSGKPLASSARCFWSVEVWDNAGRHGTSAAASWVAGVMKPEDWKAAWIGANPETCKDFDLHGAEWIWAGNAARVEVAPPGTDFYRAFFEVDGNAVTAMGGRGYAVANGMSFTRCKPGTRGTENSKPAALAVAAFDKYTVTINGTEAAKTPYTYVCRRIQFINASPLLKPGRNEIVVRVDQYRAGKAGLLLALTHDGRPLVVSGGKWEVAERADTNKWKAVASAGAPDAEPFGKIERAVETEPPAFEKAFTVGGGVARAVLHVTAGGFYEAWLDGRRIGDKVLDPSPTRTDRRVLYSTYDLTGQLGAGAHTLRILVGHGWHDVRAVDDWSYDMATWRGAPCVLAQLEIERSDGSRQTVATDGTWLQVPSPVLYDDIREGETDDPSRARRAGPFPNGLHAAVVAGPAGRLVAEAHPGAKVCETIKPVSIKRMPPPYPGWMVDFGQNMAGWLRLSIHGAKRGDVVTIQYGEKRDKSGINLSGADDFSRYPRSFLSLPGGWFQRDRHVCSGEDGEIYEPRFAYHGFQYAHIDGVFPLTIGPDDVEAKFVRTAFPEAGTFECSNPTVNRIQHMVVSSYKSNFTDGYPTDCPTREKLGWTGDASLAAEAGLYNFQNAPAYEKWIRDILDEQREDGNIPCVVPASGNFGFGFGSGPVWDSAFFQIPWLLYAYWGDTRVIEEAYPGWVRYLDYLATHAKGNIVEYGLGDFHPHKADTPLGLVATGYYYLDVLMAARAAELLDKKDDAKKYSALATDIRAACAKKYKGADGVWGKGSQCSQACALHQGLVTSTEEREAAERGLKTSVENSGGFLRYGILGSKYVYRSLNEAGLGELAYTMCVTNADAPNYSYGFLADRLGMTTLPDGVGGGWSNNHIMFGDISAWFYQYLGGIRLDAALFSPIGERADASAAGMKRFLIAPEPPNGLNWVHCSHESPYGRIGSDWKILPDETFQWTATVPPNSEAMLVLPPGYAPQFVPPGLAPEPPRAGRPAWRAGSGVWAITATPVR